MNAEIEISVAEKLRKQAFWLTFLALALAFAGFFTKGIASLFALLFGGYALSKMNNVSIFKPTKMMAIASIILPVITILLVGWNMRHNVRAQKFLSAVDFASLPKSADNIMIYRWSTIFSGEDYLKFSASPEDIEVFIANSPKIASVEPIYYGPEHMYLPQSQMGNQTDESFLQNDYYQIHGETPDWYTPTIKVKGRVYDFTGVPYGKVIVDDKTHTVYIRIVWG